MPVVNVYEIDTTPGSTISYHFAPPEGWNGSKEDYLNLMRSRYLDDKHLGMLMLSTARGLARGYDIVISGPFADSAKEIINKLTYSVSGGYAETMAGVA